MLLFFAAPDSRADTTSRQKALAEAVERIRTGTEIDRDEAAYFLRKNLHLLDVPWLIEQLQGSNPDYLQRELLEALGRLEDTRASKALLFGLDHYSESLKPTIVEALGRVGDDFVVEALYRTLTDKKQGLPARKAASALARIGTKKAVDSLSFANRPHMRNRVNETSRHAIKLALAWADKKIVREGDSLEIKEAIEQVLFVDGVPFYYYQPVVKRHRYHKSWLLVCVHDGDRDVASTFKACVSIGKQRRVAVLAPLFDEIRFPEYQYLSYREEIRADSWLISALDKLGQLADVHTREVYMVGVGDGGTFVNRFAAAHPERVARAVIDTDEPLVVDENIIFPFGIKSSKFAESLAIDAGRYVKVDMIYSLYRRRGDLESRLAAEKGKKWLRELYLKSDEIGVRANIVGETKAFIETGTSYNERMTDALWPDDRP
ncbi:MAG: HEAT repeat domain-containing protein [bacterium]|nr:HEAT repeat domain-containing protein [bacterium]